MGRPLLQAAVIALIFLFVGVAGAAAVFEYIPDPGSPPAFFDDFAWSSVSNGFWHVNSVGGTARVRYGTLTLSGASIELDRRLQTDPYKTIVIARVRGIQFHKFQLGLGVYHSGTDGIEFDDDGVKCGRATDQGWKIDYLKGWKNPPVGQWLYVSLSVVNPYPNVTNPPDNPKRHVTVRCSLYDGNGRLIATEVPTNPEPNSHYPAFDEAYLRTWDHGNRYQIDWVYAGPPSGNPARRLLQAEP